MNLEQIKSLDLKELQKDPSEHLRVLYHFHTIVRERVLGENNSETREEFDFLLERTTKKINDVKQRIL